MMKNYRFTVLIERDEDGVYIASVPSLQGCHTYGETLSEVQERIEEAIQLCLEVHAEDNIASEPDNAFVGAYQLEMAV
jgi:predicted RNase H-like HicB family nuclease